MKNTMENGKRKEKKKKEIKYILHGHDVIMTSFKLLTDGKIIRVIKG